MINKVLCVLVVVLGQTAWSQNQDRANVNGKIVSNTNDLEGVYVVNAQTEVMVTTAADGAFSIMAKPGDTLVFSSIQFKENRILLTSENFTDLNFTVKLSLVMHQLQEVIVKRYDNINARDLGIVSSNQNTYTEAERKLKTAGDFKPIHLLGLLGGSLQVDPILNAINGRTKQLKKQVAVEKKEHLLVKLENQFDDNYYIDQLNIPQDYVDGFKYYIISDASFVSIFSLEDKLKTQFKMSEMSVKYNQIVANEN